MSFKSLEISSARFLMGATKTSQLPSDELPEVVVAGRSNVGKSSLLRQLFGSKKLVRVSKTPGRTREINLFEVVTKEDARFRVADLPGYGYAKVSKSLRHEWGQFITEYLDERSQITLVLVLVDARRMLDRGLDDMERSFLEWLQSIGRRHALVFTKIDKVPKTKWGEVENKALRTVGRRIPVVLFSSSTGHGLEDLKRLVARHI